MLNKRAHILFDQGLWDKLLKMAKEENTSVGEVVRSAVEEKLSKEEEAERRIKAIDSILKHRKRLKGKVDYKALINEGRRF